METAQELLEHIKLEQIEQNIFRGTSLPIFGKRVYGGQVLAQALTAANATVPADRFVHSLHSYFILGGDASRPIVYEVERLRDGGSFTTRRVTAIQHGRAIFNLSASFQVEQDGFEHQTEMPNVPPPEELLNTREVAEQHIATYPDRVKWEKRPHPVEFKLVEQPDWVNPSNREPLRHLWLRVRGELPDDKRLHQTVLAYASDFYLLGTSILPHRGKAEPRDLQLASLDHAMWFHRACRIDEWHLYVLDSPSASNARGFNRGSLFSRDGKLVASMVQEGLIRPKRKKE
ncbi:MAG: acyl-CoA thioesterase II [Candidatus Promineifilaceae bacterium]